MKDIKEFVKDIFQNKRKKALLSLGLWIIFFIVVFILVGRPSELQYDYQSKSNQNSVETESSLDNFKNMENFEYSYLIEITENNINDMYKIEGTYYNNKYYFETNGNTYYISDNVIYLVDDTLKRLTSVKEIDPKSIFNRIDIKILTKDSIYSYISASEQNSSTTYKDGNVTKNNIYKSYNNRLINITINEYGNIIRSIELDFSKYFDITYQMFKVSATYKNINNIASYNKNYDDYEIIREGE